MAKDYSERTKALDDIFQRLMVNSGITPEGSDNVTVYKGSQREDWAFPKQGEGQWGEGVNVTPFQYRAPAEQKILGEMFEKLYGSGAQYENAAANKVAAGAAASNAGTSAGYLDIEKKIAKLIIDEKDEKKKKEKALEAPSIAGPPPAPSTIAAPAYAGRGGGVQFNNPYAVRQPVTGVAPNAGNRQAEDYWEKLKAFRAK